MKRLLAVLFLIMVAILLFFGWDLVNTNKISSPISKTAEQKEKPLDKYTIEALTKTKFEASEITIGEILKDETDFTSLIFYFYVSGKKVSGLLNVPKGAGISPLVVMFRGYIDREKYTTGAGTERAGEVFAKNGFITLAPDFLGYGESENPSGSAIEERFQTYTTALILVESVKNLEPAIALINPQVKVDIDKIGIWGHSNGGQIALTALEITGKNYPTVLWAPVSKPFPYSILYYTDDFDDHGKMLRRVVADFEKDYDAEFYSLTNYLNKINAPIQLHQGSADEAVPIKWSEQLVEKLKELEKEVAYFTYPGDDHNFANGNWSAVVARNIAFYRENFKK